MVSDSLRLIMTELHEIQRISAELQVLVKVLHTFEVVWDGTVNWIPLGCPCRGGQCVGGESSQCIGIFYLVHAVNTASSSKNAPVGQPVGDLISEWCLMPCSTPTSRIRTSVDPHQFVLQLEGSNVYTPTPCAAYNSTWLKLRSKMSVQWQPTQINTIHLIWVSELPGKWWKTQV